MLPRALIRQPRDRGMTLAAPRIRLSGIRRPNGRYVPISPLSATRAGYCAASGRTALLSIKGAGSGQRGLGQALKPRRASEPRGALFEDEDVRVLEVTIAAGHREPEHTHRDPSVMIVDGPAKIRYYQGMELTFSSQSGDMATEVRAQRMDPEGPHSVENFDTHPYHAFRIELRH